MTLHIRTNGPNPRDYVVGEESIRHDGTSRGAITSIDKNPENFVLHLPNLGCMLIPRRNAVEV